MRPLGGNEPNLPPIQTSPLPPDAEPAPERVPPTVVGFLVSSADGKLTATVDRDGTLRVGRMAEETVAVPTENGPVQRQVVVLKLVYTLGGDGGFVTAVFAPQAPQAAAGAGTLFAATATSLYAFDMQTGKTAWSRPLSAVGAIVTGIECDGREVRVTVGAEVIRFDAATGGKPIDPAP